MQHDVSVADARLSRDRVVDVHPVRTTDGSPPECRGGEPSLRSSSRTQDRRTGPGPQRRRARTAVHGSPTARARAASCCPVRLPSRHPRCRTRRTPPRCRCTRTSTTPRGGRTRRQRASTASDIAVARMISRATSAVCNRPGIAPSCHDETDSADLFPLVLLSVGAASDRLFHGLRSGRHHSIDSRMRSSVRRPILLIVGLLST